MKKATSLLRRALKFLGIGIALKVLFSCAVASAGNGNPSGQPPVVVSGAVTVSGSVTANAGTNLNTSALALESGGNLTTLAGGVTGGQYQINISQYGGVTVGAMANYGTSPGAVKVPGVNSFVTNTVNVLGTGSAGTAASGVVTVQGIVSMTPVQVSQATASNLNANVTQATAANLNATVVQATAANLNATVAQATAANLNATVVGAGVAGTPSGGVVSVQGVSGGVAQPGNITQFGGTNISTGTGAGGSGIPRVTISNDSSLAANQSVNTAQIGGTAVVADPCQAIAKINVAISQATSAQIITGTSAKKTYICSIIVVAADAENISLVEGTGSVCATNTAAVIGGATAANGPNLSANGGFTQGSGMATIAIAGAINADNVCLFQSSTGRVAGNLTYVQQ